MQVFDKTLTITTKSLTIIRFAVKVNKWKNVDTSKCTIE